MNEYLNYLGLERALKADRTNLHRLHEAHLLSIPFDNLSVRAKEPILLNEQALAHKFLAQHRGGFCYELNGMFALLLEHLGYRVERVQARVARPEGGFGQPFDHMALLLHLDEPTLVDVGFGDSFILPLPLREEPQYQRDFVFQLQRKDQHYILQKQDQQGAWQDKYIFDLTPYQWDDYQDMCHYHQTSPESTFTQKVVCSKLTNEGRITLTATRLIVTRGQDREEHAIASPEVWSALYARHFNKHWRPPANLLKAIAEHQSVA